jgi:spore coat polysaccharide biosynthesis protein SpsF (cytidylyltransferase family)
MSNEKIETSNKLIAEFMGYMLVTPEMRRHPDEWKLSYWENPKF